MFRRQSDEDGEPQDRTGLIISLLVLFLVILILFLVILTDYLRSQAEATSVADIAATEAALGSGVVTSTPDFGNLLLLSTDTVSATSTEIITAIPIETETPLPTEVITAVPLQIEPFTPTPETIIPVTGADLQEEQAVAARQWIRIGVGILAVSLIGLGLLLRLKHK